MLSKMAALRQYCTLMNDIHRTYSLSVIQFRQLRLSTGNRQTEENKDKSQDEESFRVFEIEGLRKNKEERRFRRVPPKPFAPRYRSMPVDQDWTNIWPAAATFKWATVPFPVRQGFIKSSAENDGVIPSKYGNLELMKAPNFLHLTPAHIKKHCAALKKFCTPWPEGLETDGKCRYHFPLETITSDFVFAAPSIRDDRARFATIKFHLSDLELDYHARDKFIRLVGDRYNKETDEVIFESGRCPLKAQNLDFLKFVLTAVYFESWKYEAWEKLKELSDMEKYFWDLNAPRKKCTSLLRTIKSLDDASESNSDKLNYLPQDVSDDEALCSLPEVKQFKVSIEEIFNEGENIDTINQYKNAVKTLLNIKSDVL